MCVRAAQKGCMQHTGKGQIGNEKTPAIEEALVLIAHYARADAAL
jgi:hypothetical protein